jgi:hypothetical protein
MNESGIYNEPDLEPFLQRLSILRGIIQSDFEKGKHPMAMIKLLERQLNECGASHLAFTVSYANSSIDSILKSMQDSLAVLSHIH